MKLWKKYIQRNPNNTEKFHGISQKKADSKGMFNGLSKFIEHIRNRNSSNEDENIMKNDC